MAERDCTCGYAYLSDSTRFLVLLASLAEIVGAAVLTEGDSLNRSNY